MGFWKYRNRAVSYAPDACCGSGNRSDGSCSVIAESWLAFGLRDTSSPPGQMGSLCECSHCHDHVWHFSADTVHIFSILMGSPPSTAAPVPHPRSLCKLAKFACHVI